MPTYTKPVAFMNPMDPSAIVDQQQIDRQLSLAQALRQQSLQDTPSNGGPISWTQGMARLMAALTANSMQKHANADLWDLAARNQNAAAVTHYGAGAPQIDPATNPYRHSKQNAVSAPTSAATAPTVSQTYVPGGQSADQTASADAPAPPTSPAPQAGVLGDHAASVKRVADAVKAANAPYNGIPPMPGQVPTTPLAGAPVNQPPGSHAAPTSLSQPSMPTPEPSQPAMVPSSQYPSPVSPVPSQAAAGPQPFASPGSMAGGASFGASDALVPTISPQQGMIMQAQAPDQYWKMVADAGAPIEDVKRVIQMGIDPHSPQGQQMLRGAAAKAMQTPLNFDRQGYGSDPYTGQVLAFHPRLPEGTSPVFDAQGNIVDAQQLPGMPGIRQSTARAEATGKAYGDTEKVWDPASGTYRLVNKGDVVTGGGPGTPGAPGGYQAEPRPGMAEAGAVRGKQSAQWYAETAHYAAGAPDRINSLTNMYQLVRGGGPFGPGSSAPGRVAELVNGIAKGIGIDGVSVNNQGVTTIGEFNKFASRYAAQVSRSLGVNGTDAGRALVVEGNPHAALTSDALRKVIPVAAGYEMMMAGMNRAGNAYARQHGYDSAPDFQTQWEKTADPRIYQLLAQDRLDPPRPGQPSATKRYMDRLRQTNPADWSALVQKSQVLARAGALPQ